MNWFDVDDSVFNVLVILRLINRRIHRRMEIRSGLG